MPISTGTTPVVKKLQSGKEYAIQATGGSLNVQVVRNGSLYSEGSVADGERLRLCIAHDNSEVDVTFTPSASGVDWAVTVVRVEDN
jgi:hypothetical protein